MACANSARAIFFAPRLLLKGGRNDHRKVRKDQSAKDPRRTVGINASIISNILNGRSNPRPDELIRLANSLGITPPERLLAHVSAAPLGDGAEFADAQREAK